MIFSSFAAFAAVFKFLTEVTLFMLFELDAASDHGNAWVPRPRFPTLSYPNTHMAKFGA